MSRKKKDPSEVLYEADKAVRDFCKEHKKDLSTSEDKKLRKLLIKRAEAISNVLGVKVHSLYD